MGQKKDRSAQRLKGKGNRMAGEKDRTMQKKRTEIALAAVILFIGWVLAAFPGHEARADVLSGYILPDSSYACITEEEVSNLPLQVLCYARNEIYARNGRTFDSAELQNYFNQQYWYHGIYSPQQFTDSMLNVYETANVQVLLKLENAQGGYALDGSYSYDAVSPYINTGYAAADDYSSYTVDPNSYIFYDSNERYLSDSEIAALSTQEMCYAKNEIYARHGYVFSSTELSDYFNSKNWYWGTADVSTFSTAIFNGYEQTNALALTDAERARGGYALDQPGYSYSGIGSYSSPQAYTVHTSDYIFYDSAIRYLTDAEVSGMSLQMLCYARNEIYARRGYIFQSEELRNYFGSKPWYYPTIRAADFSGSVFNSFETANIALLRKYEYAVNPNGYQLY